MLNENLELIKYDFVLQKCTVKLSDEHTGCLFGYGWKKSIFKQQLLTLYSSVFSTVYVQMWEAVARLMQYQHPPPPNSTVPEVMPDFLMTFSMSGGGCWKAVAVFTLWVIIWMSGSHTSSHWMFRLCNGRLLMTSAAVFHCDVKWPYWCFSDLDICLTVTWWRRRASTLCNVLLHTRCQLLDPPLQIFSDIGVLYGKEMLLCMRTATIKKKFMPKSI